MIPFCNLLYVYAISMCLVERNLVIHFEFDK